MMGDDYPWASQVRDGEGHATSVYNTPNPETGYYYGNCTDFVFWRVNRDMGASVGAWLYTHDDLTPHGGNGRLWGKDGSLPGWKVIDHPTDAVQGDVISFETGIFGHNHPAGHVAYIASVNTDGDITTENYGVAQYYVETIPEDTARDLIASGGIVIKRNPALATAAANSTMKGGTDASVLWARSQIVLPYGRGKGNGSIDCCWLVHNALAKRGIQLPMSIPGNPAATSKCEYAMYAKASTYSGKYVSATVESLLPGDILFFQSRSVPASQDNITHVALYVGGGKLIDAIPSGGVGVRNLAFYNRTDALLAQAVRIGG